LKAIIKKIRFYLGYLHLFNLKSDLNKISHCDVLLYCHDANRGLNINGKAYSPLIDSIREKLEADGFSCITIAKPMSKLTGELAYGAALSINRPFIFSLMLKLPLSIFKINPIANLYKKIISLASPKTIISIGCDESLCEAAHQMKVFHVELLHGIGYTPLPWGWEKKEIRKLPQGIISLDPVSTKTFSELKNKKIVVKEIAHPFITKFKSYDLKTIPNEWLPSKKNKKYQKEVLINLQWGFADGIDALDINEGVLMNGLFYEELETAIKISKNDILWRFRFHPVQLRNKKKYKRLFEYMEAFVRKYENTEYKESSTLPLPSLALSCNSSITMSSMAAYDFAYFGIKTLFLSPALLSGKYKNMFDDLVRSGLAKKSDVSVTTILDWVYDSEKTPCLMVSEEKISWVNLKIWLGIETTTRSDRYASE